MVHSTACKLSTESYQKQGYLTGIEVLNAQELAKCRATFNELEAQHGEEASAISLAGKHKELKWIWDLAVHPKVLEMARTAIGPDLLLLGTHFFCKYPEAKHGTHFVAWHQDITYWNLTPLEQGRVTTIWLAMDDADVENGCMRVIPGSHQRGLLAHGESNEAGNLLSQNQAIAVDSDDESQAVDIELPAGTASMHDGLLIHGSNPNRSQRRRCGLTIRFTEPSLKPASHADNAHHWTPFLVAGEDRYHHFDVLPNPH